MYPPECFEEGAEFLESLSKSFDNAHGTRLKVALAETLFQLLYSTAKVRLSHDHSSLLLLSNIAQTAQAEVNHPQWAKAIEIIHPKARDMSTKPRYWQAAYPLAVVSLCVAPRDYFARNWISLVESGLAKLKVWLFVTHKLLKLTS